MINYKSHREIDALEESAQLVSKTLAEVARHIQPGVRTAELDSVAETFVRDHGGTPAFKGYQMGNGTPFPGTLCISCNDEVVHGIPGENVLAEGDIVSVDCGVLLNGFYGDSAYTFAVGEIDPETRRLLTVTYESLIKGVESTVAGKRIGDIGHAVQTHCESAGFGVVYEMVGHGIGSNLHEDPQIPNVGRPGDGKKLKDGLTICIEPMINGGAPGIRMDEDGWTVRTVDGKPSAHYEHMVAVQGGTPRVLSTFAHIEAVIDAPYAAVTH